MFVFHFYIHEFIDDILFKSLRGPPFPSTKKREKGVMAVYLYIPTNIHIKPNLSFQEACLLEMRLRGGDLMLFGCIYRSPS